MNKKHLETDDGNTGYVVGIKKEDFIKKLRKGVRLVKWKDE